jgi:hypothetical protein
MEIEDIKKALSEVLSPLFKKQSSIIKSVDNEERRALFVAMEPDVYDAHNDITSKEEVEKACNNFNKYCMRANLFHRVETDAVDIQQSFIAPTDIELDTGRIIRKGSWLMWMHFPEDNEVSSQLWDMVKTGDVNGISIGARAVVEDIS